MSYAVPRRPSEWVPSDWPNALEWLAQKVLAQETFGRLQSAYLSQHFERWLLVQCRPGSDFLVEGSPLFSTKLRGSQH